MIYKIISDKPIKMIKAEIVNHAKESGFGVLGSYEFKKILSFKGFPIQRDITLYELCNPSVAQEILDAMPEASVFLPCRLSLYEENDKSVLATIDIEAILHTLNAENDLKLYMQSVFEYLQKLMKTF